MSILNVSDIIICITLWLNAVCLISGKIRRTDVEIGVAEQRRDQVGESLDGNVRNIDIENNENDSEERGLLQSAINGQQRIDSSANPLCT